MKKWIFAGFLFSVCGFAENWNGYIVDQSCASHKNMWTDAQCVARCVRRGSEVVLVTEDEKVFKIANQDKVAKDFYGKKVTVSGKMEGETITVESLK